MVSTGIAINVAFTVIMATTGSLGNLLLILSFIREKSLWSVNNIFILQFAISDFVKTTVILTSKAYNQAKGTTEITSAFCPIGGMITTIGFTQPVLALAAIALVRYFRVCKPWAYKKVFTMKRAKWYCVGIFTATFVFSLFPFFGVGTYAYSKYHGVCFTDWRPSNTVFRSIMYVYTIGIPYPILIFCYLMIFKTLRQHGMNISASQHSIASQNSESDLSKAQEADKLEMNRMSKALEADTIKKEAGTIKNEKLSVNSTVSISENGTSSEGPAVYTVTVGVKKYKMSQMEVQVTKLMFVIVVAYTICWIPPFIATFMTLGGYDTPDSVLMIIVTLADLKACVNPFIYGIGSRQFREAVKSFCKVCIPACMLSNKLDTKKNETSGNNNASSASIAQPDS